MAFRVEFSELVAGESRRLDRPVRERIGRKLLAVAKDPARFLTRLSSIEACKVRIGDYRAIVNGDWGRQVMCVLSVGHRSVVHRR